MNTKTTKPPTTPTPQPSSSPASAPAKWHPLDDQEQFEEDNAQQTEKLLASAQARRQASNDPSAEALTQLREELLGRPLTQAETDYLDSTGLG